MAPCEDMTRIYGLNAGMVVLQHICMTNSVQQHTHFYDIGLAQFRLLHEWINDGGQKQRLLPRESEYSLRRHFGGWRIKTREVDTIYGRFDYLPAGYFLDRSPAYSCFGLRCVMQARPGPGTGTTPVRLLVEIGHAHHLGSGSRRLSLHFFGFWFAEGGFRDE